MMTHATVSPEERKELGITDTLVCCVAAVANYKQNNV